MIEPPSLNCIRPQATNVTVPPHVQDCGVIWKLLRRCLCHGTVSLCLRVAHMKSTPQLTKTPCLPFFQCFTQGLCALACALRRCFQAFADSAFNFSYFHPAPCDETPQLGFPTQTLRGGLDHALWFLGIFLDGVINLGVPNPKDLGHQLHSSSVWGTGKSPWILSLEPYHRQEDI